MFNLTSVERRTLQALRTPLRIQSFIERLPRNFEKHGDTLYSPRLVLRHKKAHCIEGALLAAAILWLHDEEPLLLDLKSTPDDDSHVVTLFKRNGYYGAISKTNHASLGWRDPIYKNPREVALSYFHEYFLNSNGKKSLRSYATYNLKRLGDGWITTEEPLLWLNHAFDRLPHTPLVPKENRAYIRKATPLERQAGRLTTWKPSDTRT